jgi:hypothetical protein
MSRPAGVLDSARRAAVPARMNLVTWFGSPRIVAFRYVTTSEEVTGVPRAKGSVLPEETKAQMRLGRAVRRYLDVLSGKDQAPARGRGGRDVESELARIEKRLDQPDLGSLQRLKLTQTRNDLLAHGLPSQGGRRSARDPEEEFVKAAKAFGELHGITYQTWLDMGVPAEVLERAGVSPESGG